MKVQSILSVLVVIGFVFVVQTKPSDVAFASISDALVHDSAGMPLASAFDGLPSVLARIPVAEGLGARCTAPEVKWAGGAAFAIQKLCQCCEYYRFSAQPHPGCNPSQETCGDSVICKPAGMLVGCNEGSCGNCPQDVDCDCSC